ncbi:hypothetical protein DLE01_03070 [Streptomyces sp. FT05W]|nr:hypothetical protein [Streptomyces sp. FT05W]PWS52745.1 hypothetical protein DLE01_03070 [Streptomyces sp. FT05W]
MENSEFQSTDIIDALHNIGTQLIESKLGHVAVVQCRVNPELTADFTMEVDVFPDFGSAFASVRMELWPVEKPSFNAMVFSVSAEADLEDAGLELPQLPLWAGRAETPALHLAEPGMGPWPGVWDETKNQIHPRFNKFKMFAIPDFLYGVRHMRGSRG